MNIELLTVLFFSALLFTLLLGLPLSFVLGGVSVIFLYFTWGPQSFYMIAAQTWGAMNKFTLIAIPLFILLAMILERAGVAEDLYDMMYLWFGPLRGGLAIGTVAICAIFAAMCGISGAAVVSMGTIALPSMLRYNYDKELALGCINAGGSLGILIPPSVIMIIYALISGESVGKLFAGGVIPGLLIAGLLSLYIAIRCAFQPHLGPALPPEERGDWPRKIKALKAVLLPALIVFMVLGSMMAGIATPTEAAAMGVLGALISAAVHRRLSWSLLKEACLRTFRLTGMIVWILFGAYCFSAAYHGMGAPGLIHDLMKHIPGGPLGERGVHTGRSALPGDVPGSCWHHDDNGSHLSTSCEGSRIRSPLVRYIVYHKHGNRLHDTPFWIQPVLSQGNCATQHNNGGHL